jgi:hypothetical protein
MCGNPRGQRLYAATPHLMYALNESLAIDGKAMYFGENGSGASDFGPRTSDRRLRPRISGHVFSFPEKVFEFSRAGDSTVRRLPLRFVDLDVGSAVDEAAHQRRVADRGGPASAPVAPRA